MQFASFLFAIDQCNASNLAVFEIHSRINPQINDYKLIESKHIAVARNVEFSLSCNHNKIYSSFFITHVTSRASRSIHLECLACSNLLICFHLLLLVAD